MVVVARTMSGPRDILVANEVDNNTSKNVFTKIFRAGDTRYSYRGLPKLLILRSFLRVEYHSFSPSYRYKKRISLCVIL